MSHAHIIRECDDFGAAPTGVEQRRMAGISRWGT